MFQTPYSATGACAGGLLGPYRLERVIGNGGMGVVYLASRSDNEFRKHVAIKILQSGVMSAEMDRRFRQERQILASLEHPNIARLLDGGTTESGEPYFVMEYVSGGLPLDRYCEEHKLPLQQKLRLFLTVCSAVQYAHQRLVVHRDLKPGNILVSPDGVVKLLDFGIAKALSPLSRQDDVARTRAGLMAMTPEYASPEQIRGDAISVASDVYTLGVVLYQLVTGRLPFEHGEGGIPELMRAICEQEPPKPSAQEGASKELAGDIDNIVLMALRKEPERRYGSVEQLGEDIRRFLAGLPVAARPATPVYRASKFLRRHLYASVAAALFVASLAGGAVATLRQARIAQSNAAKAQARFEDLRKLAGEFIFELEGEISPLPGSTKARKMLVDKAKQYLELLAREHADDPKLSTELATAYATLGNVQRARNKHSLGDTEGARSSFRRALEVADAAVARNGASGPLLIAKMRALAGLGDIAWLDGDYAQARQRYQESLAAMEQNLRLPPAEASIPRMLLPPLGKLAEAYEVLGQDEKALECYRRAAAITATQVEKMPLKVSAHRDRSVSLSQLGLYFLKRKQWDEAMRNFSLALAHIQEMKRLNPGSGLRDEMVAEASLGRASSGMKKFDQAVAHHRRQLSLAKEGLAKDNTSVLSFYDLSGAEEQLAKALLELGKLDEAQLHAEAALKAIGRAQAIDPASTMTLAILNSALRTNALLLEARNDVRGAEAAFHRMLARNEQVVQQKRTPGLKQELAKRYREAADFHRALALRGRDSAHHWREVQRLLSREIELRRELQDEAALRAAAAELQKLPSAATSH